MAVACGFYGEGSVVAEQLMDVESRLTEEERGAICRVLADFAAEFPQLFFMMYLGGLPPPANPRQFSFWLLNHAAVQDVDVLLPNERGLLLVVDPRAGTAVLAAGYFLENFVTQEELDAALRTAQKELGRADYAGAVRCITGGLTTLLKKKAKEAAKHPAMFRQAPGHTGPFPPLVRTGERVMGEVPAPAIGMPGPLEMLRSVEAETAPITGQESSPRPAAKPNPVRRIKSAARRHPPRRS